MRSKYRVREQNGIYFITSTVVEWIPLFTSSSYINIILDSLKFCQDHKNLKIYAFIIMTTHFHLVVSCPRLTRVMQSIKRHTARELLELLKRDKEEKILRYLKIFKKSHKREYRYQVWQEGFHPQLIPARKLLVQKINYIHNNPVKKGWVDQPEQWVYSSALYLLYGGPSLLAIDHPSQALLGMDDSLVMLGLG